MTIAPFLRDQAFGPEVLKNMGDAFAEVRKALGLKDRGDRLTELVARRIIDLAREGVQTETGLYLLTVQKFKSDSQ